MKIVSRWTPSVTTARANVLTPGAGMKTQPTKRPELKAGDIIACSGYAWTSFLINFATYGLPCYHASHVGIIGEYNGELLLFESTTLDDLPCVIQGEQIDGVKAVRLKDRVEQYSGRIWHYPLFRHLYVDEAARLNEFLCAKVGTPYDKIGAIRAGGIGWSWIEHLLHREDLSFIFCSELCAAAHTKIGLLRTDNVSRWNPNRFVRRERRERILRKPWRVTCEDFVQS